MRIRKIQIPLDEEEPIKLGLLKLVKKCPSHEFFFELNRHNPSLPFVKISDFQVKKEPLVFLFQNFQACDEICDVRHQIIANRSFSVGGLATSPSRLFNERDSLLLLQERQDIDYISRIEDGSYNFSLNSSSLGTLFHIEEFFLEPGHILYKNMQENE